MKHKIWIQIHLEWDITNWEYARMFVHVTVEK